MIAGLVLFLVLPLVVGGVVYALRRWVTLAALLSAGTTLGLGIAILVLPLGRVVELWGRQIVMGGRVSLLGRELILQEADRIAIAFLYLTASGLFLLAWRMSPGALLFPAGLASLSLLSGSLLIRPLIYAVLLVEIAAGVSVFALQPEGGRSARGALQYLSFSLLAMPGLLVIHWLMDRYALTPDNRTLLTTARVLLALSFALLMGSIPFQMWMPSVARDSEPLGSAFVFAVNHGAIWFLLLAFLETYPDLISEGGLGEIASGAGVGMIVVGGVLAASQRRLRRLMGYGALIDSGVALVALGATSGEGLGLVLLCVFVRPFGLGLMAAGLKRLVPGSGNDGSLEALRGVGRRRPWSTVSFVAGAVSLAGLPVSAGFAGRWAVYRVLAVSDLGTVATMIGGSLGLMVGAWRGLWAVLEGDGRRARDEEDDKDPSEEWLMVLVTTVAVVSSTVAGLNPQLFAPLAARLANFYTFLTP